jgi:ceramide glucosyltransferase
MRDRARVRLCLARRRNCPARIGRVGTNEPSPCGLLQWRHSPCSARPSRGRRHQIVNTINVSPTDLVFLGVSILTMIYWLVAMASVVASRGTPPAATRFSPPVTVLKPLRGDDGYLYENLRSFCVQDYPAYEVTFGVQDSCDPAVVVVERLIREIPDVSMRLVVDERRVGTNPKINNVVNLVGHAKHDTLILSDSDMRVTPSYLRAVVAPLEDSAVGLVTCLYYGVAPRGVVSRLGAMFINEWLFPAALVSTRIGRLRHAFGATIGCRRGTLRAIGGFEAVADHLADDYMLGWLTSRRDLRVALAPYIVENVVAERDLRTLFFHELRWARTLRTLRPVSYACSLFTYGFPLSLLWVAASGAAGLSVAALVAHLGLRCVARIVVSRSIGRLAPWSHIWLIPIRDLASCALGILSFLGHSVRWGDEHFRVRSDGHLEPEASAAVRARRAGGAESTLLGSNRETFT